MLHQKIESGQYINEFRTKMSNFINKAPILASFVITPQGVDVIHENTKRVYHYDWDFTKHVKSFIHDIKLDIINHYPRLLQVITTQRALTPEEQAIPGVIAQIWSTYDVDNSGALDKSETKKFQYIE